jgi:hypothetical protein
MISTIEELAGKYGFELIDGKRFIDHEAFPEIYKFYHTNVIDYYITDYPLNSEDGNLPMVEGVICFYVDEFDGQVKYFDVKYDTINTSVTDLPTAIKRFSETIVAEKN